MAVPADYSLLSIGALSFLITLIATPFYIRKAKESGVVGRNMYSPAHEEVAETGGLTILAGFIGGLFLALRLYPEQSTAIFALATTALLVTIVGLFDDIFGAPWTLKSLLPLLAVPPLIAIKAGVTRMWIPLLGYYDFGLAYTLLLLPIAVTGAANAMNMIAGFNGLEAGIGVIMSLTLTVSGYIVDKPAIMIFSVPMLFSCLAFLAYNWYPAKVFPGDTGTYLIGVIIAVATVLGNLELIGAILFMPHIINFLMYFYGYFKRGAEITRRQRFGSVTSQGFLRAPHPYYLPFFVVRLSDRMTERKAVMILLGIEAVFALIALFVLMRH